MSELQQVMACRGRISLLQHNASTRPHMEARKGVSTMPNPTEQRSSVAMSRSFKWLTTMRARTEAAFHRKGSLHPALKAWATQAASSAAPSCHTAQGSSNDGDVGSAAAHDARCKSAPFCCPKGRHTEAGLLRASWAHLLLTTTQCATACKSRDSLLLLLQLISNSLPQALGWLAETILYAL
mmetsp:Transcript_61526/g.146780  ORF Transcript_61526/g.146780 Transcript_61526/m.146780 type:complete len:182 (+) Transcript_61526:1497-2042(+)